jgi:hypothetical protein
LVEVINDGYLITPKRIGHGVIRHGDSKREELLFRDNHLSMCAHFQLQKIAEGKRSGEGRHFSVPGTGLPVGLRLLLMIIGFEPKNVINSILMKAYFFEKH